MREKRMRTTESEAAVPANDAKIAVRKSARYARRAFAYWAKYSPRSRRWSLRLSTSSPLQDDPLAAGVPEEPSEPEQREGPGGVHRQREERRAAGDEPQVEAARRVVHVRERQPREDAPEPGGEERRGDQEAREELQHQVLRAEEAEDRRRPDGDEADAEVEGAHEDGGEAARHDEEQRRGD